MADYIRFRFNAGKASVTMAFLALLGGITSKAGAQPQRHDVHAREAKTISWFPKLSLNGLNGNLKTALVGVEKDLADVYKKQQKAVAEIYVKEQKAIGDAVGKVYAKVVDNFYDKKQTNATFLTQADAAKDYIKEGATVANSSELGGLAPSAFFQGDGGIATGAATALNGGTMPLVTAGDGSLTVKAALPAGGGPTLEITNNTSNAFTWIATIGGVITDGTLNGGATANLALPGPNNVSQASVQLIPAVRSEAVTLTVSTEPSSGPSGGQMFIGQMLIGLL